MLTTPGNGKKQARESEGFPGLSRKQSPIAVEVPGRNRDFQRPPKGSRCLHAEQNRDFIQTALDDTLRTY